MIAKFGWRSLKMEIDFVIMNNPPPTPCLYGSRVKNTSHFDFAPPWLPLSTSFDWYPPARLNAFSVIRRWKLQFMTAYMIASKQLFLFLAYWKVGRGGNEMRKLYANDLGPTLDFLLIFQRIPVSSRFRRIGCNSCIRRSSAGKEASRIQKGLFPLLKWI